MTTRQLERRLQLGVTRGTEARMLTEAPDVGAQQRAQRAEFLEDLARQVDGARTATADANHQRQQLRFRQRARTELQQFFARAFRARPIANRHGEIRALAGTVGARMK